MTVSEKLRLVQGLHSHAEMFGFNWDDGSDWTWHDVACKIADEIDVENAKLREAVATAIKVQAVLCGDADSPYCHKECPLHRQESDDCLACDVIEVAQELGLEVWL